MVFRDLVDSLRRNLAEIGRLNSQIASGRRIERPSDDPAGAARALGYRVVIDAAARYRANGERARGLLTAADSALASASDALARVKELALQGASGTQSPESRSALAAEARQLAEHLGTVANTRFGGRYLFAGFRTDRPAFDEAFSYAGDEGVVRMPVDRGVSVPVNVTGTAAFGLFLDGERTAVISQGRVVHYTPEAGGGVSVEIRAADDTTVLDSFRFDNVMQMTALLAEALGANDTARVEALVSAADEAAAHTSDVRAEVGARLARLDDQARRLDDASLAATESLSRTEDADLAEAASGIARADAALEALRTSSARIVSRSLLDFLE